MSTTIGIVGRSGSGKSSSIENLDPKETYLINCDKKSLPFKGWKSKYNSENKNYWQESDIDKIRQLLPKFSKAMPNIKTIIIDTVNAIMLDDEMAKSKQKGFDKWMDLAQSIYQLIVECNELPDYLNIVLMFHSVEERDDSGYISKKILTNGRKLEKIQLETKLPIVLFTRVSGTGGNNTYQFETQSENSTGKSPKGMFSEFLIPNDLKIVIDAIKAYE